MLRYTNLYVAGGAALLTAATPRSISNSAELAWRSATAGFFGVLCIYVLDRLVGTPAGDPDRAAFLQRKTSWMWALAIGAAVLCVSATALLPTAAWGWVLLAGSLAGAYCLPVIPWRGGTKRLSEVPLAKAYVVAAAWALATAVAPGVEAGLASEELWSVGLERFCFIAGLTIPFDLRDWAIDRRAGLVTTPMALGEQGSLALAAVWLGLSAGLAWRRAGLSEAWPEAVASGVSIVWVLLGGRRRGSGYYAWGLDGMLWAWAIGGDFHVGLGIPGWRGILLIIFIRSSSVPPFVRGNDGRGLKGFSA